MKYYLFLVLILLSNVYAGESKSSDKSKLFLGVGSGSGSVTAMRLSKQDIISHNSSFGFDYLSDIGVSYWKDDTLETGLNKQKSSNFSISYSRILRKYITNNIFFDTGLGLSLHSEDSIGGRDLGSHYQFESRVGLGYERLTYRSVLSMYHYSNGGTNGKNQGMNVFMLNVSKYF